MFEYLSLHTKVRRLGYLKLLIEQYFDRDFLPVNSFNQFFEKVAGDKVIQKQLNEYSRYYRKDNKGVIEFLGTGISAEPYTRLAEDMSIIAKSNYSFVLTKHGKVYKVVYERYKKEREKFRFIEELKIPLPVPMFPEDGEERANLFVLNSLDRFFFLKMILEKDFFYIKSILNIIRHSVEYPIKNKKVKYALIKENLFKEILFQLKGVSTNIQLSKSEKIKALEFERKIASKNLQLRSFEDIVEPRINWLLDLDLIDGRKHQQDILSLTEQGEILLKKINEIFDIDSFVESEFVATYCAVYKITPKNDIIFEKRIEKYINYAFINFKTLAPNRINASQAFNYISIMCLLRDGIIAEYKDIKKYIFTIDGKGYTIDWFPSENDGSIKISK